MNEKFLNYLKNICVETSKLSTCVSKQVGAVLIKDKRIIAMGYNGVPSKIKHCNEIFDKNDFDREKHHEWSKLNEYHAEENVLIFCLRHGINITDSILIASLSPCINCAKIIANSGIKEVYYLEEYDKDSTGLEFLKKSNVKIVKL
jgi:dCMP deaminase